MAVEQKPFDTYRLRITPLDVIKGVGGMILDFCSMHQLASHGDHFEHPLDEPVEPVTDWPGQPYFYPAPNQMTFDYEAEYDRE